METIFLFNVNWNYISWNNHSKMFHVELKKIQYDFLAFSNISPIFLVFNVVTHADKLMK